MTVLGEKPRLTLGRMVYLAWYQPVGFLRQIAKHGAGNSFLAAVGERQMRLAAATLPALPWRADNGPDVAFLSGRRHWHQTVFCAWSLLAATGSSLSVTIYDDGSLDDNIVATLERVLAGVRVVRRTQIEATLERFLPADRFPTLRHRRLVYPHLRKLTDIHVGRRGPIVVLDSDMLF